MVYSLCRTFPIVLHAENSSGVPLVSLRSPSGVLRSSLMLGLGLNSKNVPIRLIG